MKKQNHDKQVQTSFSTLAFAMASMLITCTACTSDPVPIANKNVSKVTGLNKDQEQVIAKAKEKQAIQGYNEQEQAAIDLAIDKVNQKTSISRDSVEHLKIRSIQWPDSSLGCPEPGVEYLQQVIPGYFVSFSFNDKIYTVHIGDGTAIICDRFNDILTKRQKRGKSIIKAHQAARVDLAKKLMVKPDQITVTKIKMETWPDQSLGCPGADMQYPGKQVEGLIIKMTCKDKEYEYRVALDVGEFISCKEIVSCHETE